MKLKKISSRRGVSILLAILIFLLCALAGTAAISMANANAGRYASATKSQQPYYSVISAALFLRDSMNKMEYQSGTVQYVYTRGWEYDGGEHKPTQETYTLNVGQETGKDPTVLKGTWSKSDGDIVNTNFCNGIREQCDQLVPYLNVPNEWYETVTGVSKPAAPGTKTVSFEIKPAGADAAPQELGTVNVTLVLGENYDLLFQCEYKDGDASLYSVILYMEATVKVSTSTGVPKYDYTDPDPTDGVYKEGSLTQTTERTVTVSWEKTRATISRGEEDTDITGGKA